MAENSSAETVSKFGVGLGIGFALYYLIRNLGFGGGRSFGGEGEGTRGEGGEARGEGDQVPSSVTPPRDDQRLEFVMVRPTSLDDKTMAFRGPGNQIYALEEVIARIKAGGRVDMSLKVRGDVIAGPADDAEAQFKNAGIDIWKPVPVKTVSGNARGQYGGQGYDRGYKR